MNTKTLFNPKLLQILAELRAADGGVAGTTSFNGAAGSQIRRRFSTTSESFCAIL